MGLRGRLCAGGVAAGLAVAAPPPAGGDTFPLRWIEPISAYSRHLVVTVRVGTLTIERGRWSATISIRNEGDVRIGLRNRFALLAGPYPTGWPDVVLPAAGSSTLPRVLELRARWSGVVGGRGVPPRSTYLRLRLGEFAIAMQPNLHLTVVSRHAWAW